MGLSAFNRMRRLKAEKEKREQRLKQVEQETEKEAGSLKDLTVAELKGKAKSLGLTGYSKLKETELIELIESAQASENNE